MCGGERGDAVWLGLCLPFLTGRTELLAEAENMAAMQSFTLGGSGGLAPTGDFGNYRCSEAHSGAF